MTDFLYVVPERKAKYLAEWITKRGGIAVWKSLDLSCPGDVWFTPADHLERPHWSAEGTPSMVITDASEFGVATYREVDRFHVALRAKHNRMAVVLTDASQRKLEKKVDKAGDGATYEFDYWTQEAVILVPNKTVSLKQWTEVTNE